MALRPAPDYVLGAVLFKILCAAASFMVLMDGVHTAADSLSREKREGTLGLLFLTDLRSHDIVLGKLAASSYSALHGVMTIIPILGLPVLMGGITGAEFARAALALLNNLFFATAVGVLCSACFRQARWAQSAAWGVVLGLAFILPWCVIAAFLDPDWSAAYPQWKLPLYHALIFSPAYAAASGALGFFRVATSLPDLFFPSLAVVHLMAWGALGLACWVLPRTWQDTPAAPLKTGFRALMERISFGDAKARLARRRELLDSNPFLWLASREPLQDIMPWIVVGATGLIVLFVCLQSPSAEQLSGLILVFPFVWQLYFLTSVGRETPRQLGADRQSGALELLLSTRLSVREIIAGQHQALLRMFGWPLLALFGLHLAGLGLLPTILSTLLHHDLDPALWIVSCACNIVGLSASLWALAWVGLWTAVKRHRPFDPGVEAVVRICVAPLLALVAILAGWRVLSINVPGMAPPLQRPAALGLMWLALVCVNSVLHALWARRNLNTRFRAEAAAPLQPESLFDSVTALFNKPRLGRPRVPA